ncbi:TonB-dependent receptor SusC [termite gut metagenome]|uniref:TonB-dependent receptor SusC n=1 Tax=termite gut metagenome TaxID=433724 RepID=A0A5J4SE60_9ZZZZ
MKKKRKQMCSSLNVIGICLRYTPIILGLSIALCTSAVVSARENGIEISQNINQQKTIQGRVIDETGEPVIGASIKIKGTNTGTITDIDGNFSFDLPAGKNEIEVSFLSYITEVITIGNNTRLNIRLRPDIQALDEVVVIGYGTVRKRDLAGSVASVKATDVIGVPTSNVMEAIQGKVAGIDIIRTSGEAGAKPQITIRGNRSINGDNSPLFIIDGIQGGAYEDLNPNDIASMDILKDASSTAIYGAQGANGVIIITTKKGEAGKVKVNYDGYWGTNSDVQYPKPLTGDAFINYRREAYRTAGLWNGSDDDIKAFSSEELQAIRDNKWINWIDLVTRTGTQQSHNVSVQSGTEKTKAFLSLGYFQEQGIFPNDEAKRYTARINVDQTINQWVKGGLYSQFAYWDKDQINKSLLSKAAVAFPLATPYDEYGNINLYPMVGRADSYSPLADYVENKAYRNEKQLNTTLNAYLEINPLKGLTYRSNLGANLGFTRSGSYYGKNSLKQTTSPSSASINNNNSYYLTWDNVITYKQAFHEIHSLGFTVLSSWTKYVSEESAASNSEQSEDSYLFYNLGAGNASLNKISSGYLGKETMSYAARAEYNLLNKYLLNASVRLDGASQLAKGNKWCVFPSISGAWIISEEAFMKEINQLDNLKLRTSWGISGNAAVEAYATQTGMQSSDSWGFGGKAAPTYKYSANAGNKDLTWEKSNTYDIGIDLGLLKRISFSVDYYHTKTTDILMKREMPTALYGVGTTMWQNIAATENNGIELSLNTINYKTKDFEWLSTITFSKDNEKITALIDGRNIIDQDDVDYSLLLDKPIKSWWNLKKLGIWQTNDTDINDYKYYGTPPKPGDIKIYDATSDKQILDDDEVYVGSNTPKWVGGFQNSFRYKGFDLSVYMFARWGQTICAKYVYGYNPAGAINTGGMQNNIFNTFDYWTPENPTNAFPRPAYNTILPTTARSLYFVDGSFFKIKTLTLGYTLPKNWLDNVQISKLRAYVTANNLFTKANSDLLMNYDPEGNGGDEMPLFKTFVVGLSVTF